MKNEIAVFEENYAQFSATTRDLGKGIAKSVSMLQLDEVKGEIANAVLEIEKITNKTNSPSALARIPFIGKFVQQAKEANAEEQLKSGNMVEVVDRLFAALEAKKVNIESTSNMLFDLKEKLIDEVAGLSELERNVLEVIDTDTGREAFLAKNLLMQVQPTLIQAKDRIGIIDATIQAASVSAQKISSMLPQLQGGLITEMGIQAGLQELNDFKLVFDATVDVVEELSADNNAKIKKTMLDVVDLAVATGSKKTQLRLTNMNAERADVEAQLKEKMNKAVQLQEKQLVKLAEVRATQDDNLLSFVPGDRD